MFRRLKITWTETVVGIAWLLVVSPAFGAVVNVYPPNGFTMGVRTSSPGDTILVNPGTYVEGGADVSHPLTIIGVGGAEMNSMRVIGSFAMWLLRVVGATVSVEGLTVTHASGPEPSIGIISDGGSPAVVIRDCVFHDLKGGAIVLRYTREALVEGNLFYGDQGGGVLVHGTLEGGSQEITGNTFIGPGPGGGGGAPVGLIIEEEAHPVVRNNIFALSSGTGVRCSSGATATFVCNDSWGNAQNYAGCPDPTGTNGNISLDPLFCNAGNQDFRLETGSPCLPENSPPGCGLIGALGACNPVTTVPDAGLVVLQLLVTPNPVRQRAEITFTGGLGNPVFEIYDPQGRVVDVIRGQQPPYIWEPGATTRPGVYFVRLRAAGSTTVTKFVLLPR
jgi:hypothetical protein